MSKWVVLGSNGMLGSELKNLLADQECLSLTKKECDITNLQNLRDLVANANYVVNCAGWTAVDAAEDCENEAYAVNAIGAENLAKLCLELEAKLIHVSTDYVFAGDLKEPYSEDAETCPKSAYGRTKLAGEKAIQKVYPTGSFIVRTAWLYGEYGNNFVKTMIDLESREEIVSVVNDQFGQPTWSFDLAWKIIELATSSAQPGIYHGTSSGYTSWYGFAQKIFELLGADKNRVKPINSSEFPRRAPRPAYSVLGHEAWAKVNIEPIRDWESAIKCAFDSGSFT